MYLRKGERARLETRKLKSELLQKIRVTCESKLYGGALPLLQSPSR